MDIGMSTDCTGSSLYFLRSKDQGSFKPKIAQEPGIDLSPMSNCKTLTRAYDAETPTEK